jgi:hypothetical protein
MELKKLKTIKPPLLALSTDYKNNHSAMSRRALAFSIKKHQISINEHDREGLYANSLRQRIVNRLWIC